MSYQTLHFIAKFQLEKLGDTESGFFIKLCLDVWNDRVQDDHLLPADLAALRHGGPGPGRGHPAGEDRGAQGDSWQW